ncbi:MAG: BppU family phage baseplate upper protein, partial [Massilibacteroides sp.]|nr:BppU family phage baseplate upper protein [Massilibacteroides sp.]
MAKKEYKVWLDLYTGKHVIAPYANQAYKYVVPFFSRGDLYGNFFYIEVQQNGVKFNLTTESVDVHYYSENKCEPIYTQGYGNGVDIVDGEVVLEIHPAVFAFIGNVTIKITITDADERVSSGEVKFNVMRGG